MFKCVVLSVALLLTVACRSNDGGGREAGIAPQQETLILFRPVDDAPPAKARQVALNNELLQRLQSRTLPADRDLTFDLGANSTLTGRISKTFQATADASSWSGDLTGPQPGTFVLAQRGGKMAGAFAFGNRMVLLNALTSGGYRLDEVDPKADVTCSARTSTKNKGGRPVGGGGAAIRGGADVAPLDRSPPPNDPPPDDGRTVRGLVAYTPAAKKHFDSNGVDLPSTVERAAASSTRALQLTAST